MGKTLYPVGTRTYDLLIRLLLRWPLRHFAREYEVVFTQDCKVCPKNLIKLAGIETRSFVPEADVMTTALRLYVCM
jgi:hypothetical protein